MGVHFVQQSRSAEKQSLKDVSTLNALRHLRKKRKTHSAEELAQMDRDYHSGRIEIINGYFRDIRDRNLSKFREVGGLLWDREANEGKLTRKLTIEVKKESHSWFRSNEEIQRDFPEVFHPAHLLQADLDPEFRALQLGYLYLAVLGRPTYYQNQGLMDHEGKPTMLLHERIHRATQESALFPYLDTTRGAMAHPLIWLPEADPEEPIHNQWEAGVIQSLYLDMLTDSMVLAASQSGLDLGTLPHHLSPFTEVKRSDYISRTLEELGRRLDAHLESVR